MANGSSTPEDSHRSGPGPASVSSPAEVFGLSTQQLLIRDLYLRSFTLNAGKVAVSHSGRSITYAQLDSESNRVAKALIGKGISPGDRVALLLRNCLEYLVIDAALAKIGAAKVPLNEMLAPGDVGYMLAHSNASLLIMHSSFEDTIGKSGQAALGVADILVMDDGTVAASGNYPGYEAFVNVHDGAGFALPELSGQEPGLIIYTGGTTGRSKGVLHRHSALLLNLYSHLMHGDINYDEQMLLCSPLPHSAQLFAAAALARGATVHLLQKFDPKDVLEQIDKQRITYTFMVPTMIYRLIDEPGISEIDLSCVRTIAYGASPITPTRLQQALSVFGPVFMQIYGQTEVPNFITTLSKNDHLDESNLTSCGRPVVFCEVGIVSSDDQFLPPKEVGEIVVKGNYTLSEYHSEKDKTREAYMGDWLRTGDLGFMNEGGYLHLVDRAKDMIISGGMNVYSSEVENVIQQLDFVEQVMVIGIPDDDWGEVVSAFIISGDQSYSEEALLEHAKAHLAKYKVPKKWIRVEEIPLTAYGKPDKKQLRANYWGDRDRGVN